MSHDKKEGGGGGSTLRGEIYKCMKNGLKSVPHLFSLTFLFKLF